MTTTTTAGASVTTATVRAGAQHGQRGTGATAVVLDQPGGRLRAPVWTGLLAGLAAVALTAVSIPILATAYDVFVPIAFLIAIGHGAAVVLAPTRPGLAMGLSAWSVLAIAFLSLGGSGMPGLAWPLPVATLITQLIVCILIGLRGDLRTAVTALLVSIAAASAPLVVTLADSSLWSTAVANLLTFHCVAILVTAGSLLAARAIPRG